MHSEWTKYFRVEVGGLYTRLKQIERGGCAKEKEIRIYVDVLGWN